jgi:hypothetical protein
MNLELGVAYCRKSLPKGGVCIFIHKKYNYSNVDPSKYCKKQDIEACAIKLELTAALNIVGLAEGIPPESYGNLDVGNQVANILFTCHNILRKRQANHMGNMEKKTADKGFTITFKGKSYTIDTEGAINWVRSTAKSQGLEFKNFSINDKDNWYGVAGPYLCFFVGFGLRLTELRLGHSSMPTQRQGEKTISFPVYKYGLYGSHHVLLVGCTFPPEKKLNGTKPAANDSTSLLSPFRQ